MRRKKAKKDLPWSNNTIDRHLPTVKQDKHRSFCLHPKQGIKSKNGKIKKLDTGALMYEGIDPNINPDHPAMKRGMTYDVDKDIDTHKRIDPSTVFENYKLLPVDKPAKNINKVRKMPKAIDMKVGGRNVTVKYTI